MSIPVDGAGILAPTGAAGRLRHLALSPVRRLLTPPGTGGWRDRLVLRAWEGYGLIKAARVPGRGATAELPVRAGGPAYTAEFFRDHLSRQLMPFWLRHSIDLDHGGYVTHLDRRGRIYANDVKLAAMQARLVYSFAAAYEALSDPACLAAAHHGLGFLRAHLWDQQHGGWLSSVWNDGRPQATHKWLWDQSYAFLGMAEYARVTGDAVALRHAQATFALLDTHAWDARHGGYYESRQRDWSVRSNDKTACVQIDMLAAMLKLHSLQPDPRLLDRLGELAQVLVRMREPRHGLLLERFHENWVYHPMPVLDQMVLGHSLKAASLLIRAARLTGRSALVDTARQLVEACLAFGWDDHHGGFYQFICRGGALARREKEWWVECEGLLALALLYQATGDARYDRFFNALADFTFTHFADSEFGDWFTTCHPNGAVHNPVKGYRYKTAFHPVEMCCDLIRYRAAAGAPA